MTFEQGQALFSLFLMLLVGMVVVVIMLKVVIKRLPKQQTHRCAVRHRHFYAILSEFVGGQILLDCMSGWEQTGILKEIKLLQEDDQDKIQFKCFWTATRENGQGKWVPYMTKETRGNPSRYYNSLGGRHGNSLYYVDRMAIYKVNERDFCLVSSDGHLIFFHHPKKYEHLIKIEDVDGYELMLPAIADEAIV